MLNRQMARSTSSSYACSCRLKCMWPQCIAWICHPAKSKVRTPMHARTHAHKLTLSQSLLGRTTDLELGVYPPQWNAVIRKPSHNCRLRHIHNTCMHLQTHRKIAVLSFISNMKYENYTPATCKILNHFCSRVFMALHACMFFVNGHHKGN